jgi:hypothetical protein
MDYGDAELTAMLAQLFGKPRAIEEYFTKHFTKHESLGDVIGRNFSGEPLGISAEDWQKACDAACSYFEGAAAFLNAIALSRSKRVPEVDRKWFAAAAVRLAKKLKPLGPLVRAWSIYAVRLADLQEEMRHFVDLCHEEEFSIRTLFVLAEVETDALLDKVDALTPGSVSGGH